MKRMKLIILFLFILILTGCSSEYTLTINDDLSVKEEAKLAPSNEYLRETNLSYEEAIDYFYGDDEKELLDSKNYSHGISNLKGSVLVSKEYKSLEDYANNTYAINQFFEDIKVTENNGIITFKTGKFKEQGGEEQDYFDVDMVKINIKSPYKFISSNSKDYKESINTYSWAISSVYDNMEIEFQIDTNENFVSEYEKSSQKKILYAILILAVIWILVLFLNLYRKDKPEYY